MELLLQRGAHACIAKNGRNLLHEAVSRGQRDMVTYILNHLTLIELDLQGQDSTGADVLMLCTKHGDVSMFRQLVSAGCSPHSDQGKHTKSCHCNNGNKSDAPSMQRGKIPPVCRGCILSPIFLSINIWCHMY